MFVRDKPKKSYQEDDFFAMAEMCTVLLYARQIRDMKDGENEVFLPMIRRRQLQNMPETVAEEMDGILQIVIANLEKAGADKEDFFRKLELGEIDFVKEVVENPAMKEALGTVIMKRLYSTEGISGDEAYAKAKELFSEMKDRLKDFIANMMMNAFYDLGKEATEKNIPLEHVTQILTPRVKKIAQHGIAVETQVNVEELRKIQHEDLKRSNPVNDPSYG